MKHQMLDHDHNARLLPHVFDDKHHRVVKATLTRALAKQLDIA